ncbi:1-aminocyclopropane-1-carboxylate deaminase/D-cysteine desulfhydrase [Algivirga pacifica]|uniref:Pyridoxal-phosphate dependent enzyme n=1 Tax=Algivirga pacifica TaxID=1162670 RepID=A0ABP9DC34_9BACT
MKQPIENTPLEEIKDPVITDYGIRLFIKRDDLTHPAISGNKWRKLKYNLQQAKKEGHKTLLTFGGAYSNHIYAVAAAGLWMDFETIGVIRGEEHLPLNPTLSFAKEAGMKLVYMDRTTFRTHESPEVLQSLKEEWGDFYTVPMGGSNVFALPGCQEIVKEIEAEPLTFDYICCACGTGGTLAGILSGLKDGQQAIGFPALKGGEFLYDDIHKLLEEASVDVPSSQWTLNCDYHFGGYAKKKPELLAFMEAFEERNQIPLEFIYTGKMMYGVYDLIQKGYFPEGSQIVVVHTGGLQIKNG